MDSPKENDNRRNLLLRLAYDGTEFFGWQVQPQRPTIQGTLADRVFAICGEQVDIRGSGRTDAGVHACGQAANLRLRAAIPLPNLLRAMNRLLPESIRVLSIQPVPERFHARHDAASKTYRYRIFRAAVCPPHLARYVLPYPFDLDEGEMLTAAKQLEGSMDFRSFASSDAISRRGEGEDGDPKSYVRTIYSSQLAPQGDELVYTVTGSGFLHHMVRNIVGTLIDVGRRRTAAGRIASILSERNRSAAGPTAAARGLHLVSVHYPPEALQCPAIDNGGDPAKID